MQKVLSALVVASMMTPALVSATGITLTPTPTVNQTPVVTTTAVNPTPTANPTATPVVTNAAPVVTTTAVSQSNNLGEYRSVACTSNTAFSTNTCDQCFEADPVKVGDRLTGLFDNWTNNTTSILVAYQNEQKMPNMVPFGTTQWTSNPVDESKIWKDGVDIAWIPSSSGAATKQFMLPPGQKVRFIESDLAAGYTLAKTDRKNGDMVGMLRYPVVYHALDNNGAAGAAKTHYECVSYKLSAPVVAPTENKPADPKPVPPQATKAETGPAETLILIVAAFFIAFGLMFSLRKRI